LLISDGHAKTLAHADGEGGLVIETVEDISSHLEANKAEYAAIDERARWGEWSKVASIPDSVIAELNRIKILRGYHVIDMKRMKQWLNDPENRFFRTRPGRV
jgi:hypothetical protein